MEDAPRLHTNSQTLSLSFTSSLIQSSMRLDAPDELLLDYTRAMMGCLLLHPAPRRVLMIGLGGGSMLKYLHRHLPHATFTVVEISQAVIDLRGDFLIPPDSERLHTVCDDGALFIRAHVRALAQAAPPPRFDVILVDGFDGAGLPPALSSRRFYEDCRAALSEDGVLVANVQADTARSREIRQRLSRAFDGALASVESDEGGNEVMSAATRTMLAQCGADFEARWAALLPVHQATLAATSTRLQRALVKGFPLG
ncbi:MAG: transferase [Aquabacterium sp.]|uniref:spermine/spermidine synthase domain-containing protein n=1 Tax=Aquabacterium sp. TaxID=1872578 RepID=UPI001D206E15|nr:transferase spermidine synthase [Aquabacterium sp.]MBT9609222.1 transferase [Aquabacterium sp.]